MRKMMPMVVCVSLFFVGLATPIHVVHGSAPILSGNSVGSPEHSQVSALTIEEAIDLALSNDQTIILLGYQYEILKLDRIISENTIIDLEEEIRNAENYSAQPTNPDVVRQSIIKNIQSKNAGVKDKSYGEEWPPELIEEVETLTASTIQANRAINAQNASRASQVKDTLTSNIDSLKNGLKNNEINKEKNQLQVAETKEGIRFMIKGRIVELLSLKAGLDFQDQHLNLLKDDIKKAETELNTGTASYNSLIRLKRDLQTNEQEREKRQKQYDLELTRLLHDINYPTNKKVELISPNLKNLKKINMSKVNETKEKFLANSFELKRIDQDLAKLAYDRKQIINKRDEGNSDNVENSYLLEEIKQQEIKIKLEEKNKIEKDLPKQVTTIYEKADEAYSDIINKQTLKTHQIEDERNLEIQYELGLISWHDYKKASFSTKQIAFDELMANYSYYLKLSEMEALERGIMFSK
ncbi:TolC family protein [Bacillus sp. FJAT-29790]|uniref:TolC family protein n=1 Tax=Bacillus sp. FJAT-29790 TaxID=1895002 RepID=UPI001C248D27|nr:TolC family protein [Bacillus sp. FJAT-29790]MBU8881115.1 TolC family protein [Bacillus sp. FJAT-29790]